MAQTFANLNKLVDIAYMVFRKKPDELSPGEVSQKLGVTRQAVMGYIDSGELKAEKRGKFWFVKSDHLQEFIANNTSRNY